MKMKRYRRVIRFDLFLMVVMLLIVCLFASVFANANTKIKKYGTRDGKTADEITVKINLEDLSKRNSNFKHLDVPLDKDIQEFIYYLSDDYNIDFTLVMALIETESFYNSALDSSTNDSGLMQINKVNQEWLRSAVGIDNFYDPYQNVRAGIYMLRRFFDKYDDPHKVLMCYNMGEYGSKILWDKGVTSSRYSRKIMSRMDEMNAELKKN